MEEKERKYLTRQEMINQVVELLQNADYKPLYDIWHITNLYIKKSQDNK